MVKMNGQQDKLREKEENMISDGSLDQLSAESKSNDNKQSTSLDTGHEELGGHCTVRLESEPSLPLEQQNRKREWSGMVPDSSAPISSPNPINHQKETTRINDARQNQKSLGAPPEHQVQASVPEKMKSERSKLRKGKWTVCSHCF